MEKRRRIGAYGIIHDDQGRVLLVRSSERSNFPGVWFLPGGGLDHGEDPSLGVIREVMEETGLQVAIAGLHSVSSDMVEFPRRNVLLHHDRIVYRLHIIGGTLISEVDGTTDLPLWLDYAELPELPLIPFAAKTLRVSAKDAEPNEPAVPDDAGEIQHSGHSLTEPKQVTRFAVYGVVTDPQDRVLLALISEGYDGAGNWHLPGGGTDFAEQPEQALLREIFEESEQHGLVRNVINVGHRHRPDAVGPSGGPYNVYSVRAVFEVFVADPSPARVTEAAGGSTARSEWFTRDELAGLPLSDLARGELLHVDQ